MRIHTIFILLFCFLDCMGQDNHGTKFYNADGSQNAYFIDTVRIDSLTIVKSKKNGQFFAIRNPSPKNLKGNIWDSPETFLYGDAGNFDCWYLEDMPESALPKDLDHSWLNDVKIEYYPSLTSMDYKIVSNSGTPKYYWLVLIRGDAYNYLTSRCVMDGDFEVIKFKNEKAYYKLLIPIWDKLKIEY